MEKNIACKQCFVYLSILFLKRKTSLFAYTTCNLTSKVKIINIEEIFFLQKSLGTEMFGGNCTCFVF